MILKKVSLFLLATSLFANNSIGQENKSIKDLFLLVNKTPSCGCCKEWVKHAENHGFVTYTKDYQSLNNIKKKYKIKREFQSCHTTVSSNGYVFEGHIPAKFIEKFLSENHPNAIGLTVPGMPLGSPGMEFDNRFMPYDILIMYSDGSSKVYAEIRE